MRLVLVGISHHRAPLEVRERLFVDAAGARELAVELAQAGEEAVCLSTCNRTELYMACDHAPAAEERAVASLVALGELTETELTPLLARLSDGAAALHLFRVAAGLDSMVPGEGEILGQVRTAFELGRPGPLLDRVFRQALHAGKKVRAQTAIAESPASVPSAAATLAQQVFDDLRGKRVLLVGAGRIAELTARNMVDRGAMLSFVANRTLEPAHQLARRFGGRALGLEEIETELPKADVVVASTGAPGVVLTADQVERATKARRGNPLFLIDLAVPRDLDPRIGELEGCYLYNLDDLETVVSETLAHRRGEAARAEAIVAEEAARFRDWQASLDVVPAILSLRARAEEIRAGELQKVQSSLGHLSDSERRAVESVTSQIVNKLLHLPTIRMKEAAAAPDGVLYADTVRHLFGLAEDGAHTDRLARE